MYEQDTEPFRSYLVRFLEHTGACVLMASSDRTLAVLREHREELERYTHVALAKESALAVAVDKEQMLAIAQRLGIGVPRNVLVRSKDEVSEAVRDIGLPAVVKPAKSWVCEHGAGGQTQVMRSFSQLVTTLEEARLIVEELNRPGNSVLFQQFLPGRREVINVFYASRVIHARFAQWVKRVRPLSDGTSSVYCQSIALPQDSGEQAERLLREIELEGYSEMEFQRGNDGKPYLTDIKPHFSPSVEIAVRAGIDFPYLLYQWACGEPLPCVEGYRVGQRMRFLEDDLVTAMRAIKQQSVPAVMPPWQALAEFSAGYNYLDWRDLLPSWTATLGFCHRVLHSPHAKSMDRVGVSYFE